MPDMKALMQESKTLLGQMGKENGPLMQAFGGLSKSTMGDGAISKKDKELIAVALGVAARCDKCIAHHVYGAVELGASRQEILEAIGVAVFMGGGPVMMYAESALQALDDFGAE